MKIESWPIGQPEPYEKNARKWSERAIATVAASIKAYGFRQPIVVDGAGSIIIGHLRLAAAKSLGLTEVPVHVADTLTPAQVKGLRIADNRTSQEADWDADLLKLEVVDLKALEYDLSLTGFAPEELAGLIDGTWSPEARVAPPVQVIPPVGLTDEDAVPEAPKFPVTELGDPWLLGDHRVLCGDSTSTDATSRLLGGHKPDVAFADPPYGVSIVKGSKVGGSATLKFGKVGSNWVDAKPYAEIAGDGSTEAAREFYHCAQAEGVVHFILWGGNYFTDFLPPSPCWVIWDKQNSGNFADVEMAWTSFDKGAKLYAWLWNGLSRAGDRKTELGTRVHPTQKPVGLFVKIFADFPFASCYDGFLGSGSTLIACEKTQRSCYGMELSPDYVDVIVARWQAFTGKTATLDGDGRTFDEIKGTRPQAAA